MPLGHLLQGGTRRTTFEGMKINLDVVQLSQHSDKATDGRTEKKRGSIPGRSRRFHSSQRPHRQLMVTKRSFSGIKKAGT